MRRFAPLLPLFALALAGPCLAAAAKPPPPVKLRPAEPAKPASKAARSKITPLAGQMVPPLSFAGAPGLTSLGLDRLGLGTADAGPACRSSCASARYAAGPDDAGGADNWRQCVLSCGSSKP